MQKLGNTGPDFSGFACHSGTDGVALLFGYHETSGLTEEFDMSRARDRVGAKAHEHTNGTITDHHQ